MLTVEVQAKASIMCRAMNDGPSSGVLELKFGKLGHEGRGLDVGAFC